MNATFCDIWRHQFHNLTSSETQRRLFSSVFIFSVSWILVIFNEVSPRVNQPSGWKSLAITVGEDGWSLWWHEHRPVRRLLRAELLEFSWVGPFKGHPQVSLLRKMHTSTEALESRSHLMRNVSRFCNKNLSVLQGYWVFKLVLLFLVDSRESVRCKSSVNWNFWKWLE